MVSLAKLDRLMLGIIEVVLPRARATSSELYEARTRILDYFTGTTYYYHVIQAV